MAYVYIQEDISNNNMMEKRNSIVKYFILFKSNVKTFLQKPTLRGLCTHCKDFGIRHLNLVNIGVG